AAACTPLDPGIELEATDVRYEVGLVAADADHLAGIAEEVVFFAREAIDEYVVVAKCPLGVPEQVDRARSRRAGENPGRLLPVVVEVLVVRVERWREQAALFPLNRLLGLAGLPERRRTLAGDHEIR